jgi:hypothetical protein
LSHLSSLIIFQDVRFPLKYYTLSNDLGLQCVVQGSACRKKIVFEEGWNKNYIGSDRTGGGWHFNCIGSDRIRGGGEILIVLDRIGTDPIKYDFFPYVSVNQGCKRDDPQPDFLSPSPFFPIFCLNLRKKGMEKPSLLQACGKYTI